MFNLKNLEIKRLSFLFVFISKINIKLLITLICLAFISSSIYANFDDLANQIITFREIIWLSCGIIFSFLSIIINAYAWKLLIKSIGCDVGNLNIMKIFLNTNIYKYLPGGVWHFVSRYNILRLDFSIKKSIESILLEPLLMLVAGLVFVPFGSFNITIFILCWSSTLVFLTEFREFIIIKLENMKAKIFIKNNQVNSINRDQNKQDNYEKISYPYKPLLVEIIFILFRFFGFLCCIKAFSIGPLISQAELISSFSLAWIIGLVIPAAPGGLGVFESVVLFCLGSQIPEAPLLASLLCYRLVSTVSDIFAALLYPAIKLLKF